MKINKVPYDLNEFIDWQMSKKDRYVNVYVTEYGTSVSVYPIVEGVKDDADSFRLELERKIEENKSKDIDRPIKTACIYCMNLRYNSEQDHNYCSLNKNVVDAYNTTCGEFIG